MPLISLIPPEKHQKASPLAFRYFQGLSKEISGMKWVHWAQELSQKGLDNFQLCSYMEVITQITFILS